MKTDSSADNNIFCRDGAATPEYSMYRPNQTRDGYILALGDAGISAGVFPAVSLTERKEYGVTLATPAARDTYRSFNALPEPRQLFALVTSSSPTSRATRNSNSITLAPPGNSEPSTPRVSGGAPP